MRKGKRVLSYRERRRRQRLRRRRGLIAAAVLLLSAAAMSQPLRAKLEALAAEGAAQAAALVSAGVSSREVTLEELSVYALQLGAYDSAERAQEEMNRLTAKGIPCILWQREQLCIVCSAAARRDALHTDAAGGEAAYVIRETLPQVRMTIRAAQADAEAAASLLMLPDALLCQLMDGHSLQAVIGAAREAAGLAYPENALCTQLAQSLSGWCVLMERTASSVSDASAMAYARATMCTLCRELRTVLQSQASEPSTASAQRTPSTAADVMPPA